MAQLKVVEFCSRLPGPLAGHLLKNLGAHVTKVETTTHRDPFFLNEVNGDETFELWYEGLVDGKDLLVVDPEKKSDLDELQAVIASADIILWGLNPKMRNHWGIKFQNQSVIIDLKASRNEPSLHDLNAMSMAQLMPLFLTHSDRAKPPVLPFAGIFFAQKLVAQSLAALLRAREESTIINEECYLLEAVDEIGKVLWPVEMREQRYFSFLHNGRYPCYQIYRTQIDGIFLAVAAIEEKYWKFFSDTFELGLSNDDRFSRNIELVKTIQRKILNYSVEEIRGKLDDHHACLSLIE